MLTFWDLTAHQRHPATVNKEAHRDVPSHGPIDARVASPRPLQAVDGQAGIGSHHSHSIVGGPKICTEGSKGGGGELDEHISCLWPGASHWELAD